MKLFGYEFNKQEIKDNIPIMISPTPRTEFDFGYESSGSLVSSQSVSYNDTGTYQTYGADNRYPDYLYKLFDGSPTHNAIIETKTKMVIGDGIVYDESKLDATQKAIFDEFLKNSYEEKSLQKIAYDCELDWQISNSFYLMITWDILFTKIINVKRIKFSKMRNSPRNEHGKVTEFYYCRDWNKKTKYGITKYPAFSILDKINTTQILFVEGSTTSDDSSYPSVAYKSGLNWVETDMDISIFTSSNIKNSFNPSLAIKMYSVPHPDKKAGVVQQLYSMFQGAKKAGTPAIMFSASKEVAPDIQTIAANELPKTFIPVADMVVEQIIRAHKGVSGILWNVSKGGALSQTNEYENAYKIFAKNSISSDRTVLEETFNRILRINGYDINLQFKEFKVFDTQIVESTPASTKQTLNS